MAGAVGVSGEKGCVLGRVMSLSDMVLEFFEEGEGSPEVYRDADGAGEEDDDKDTSSVGGGSAEERKAFWETQHQLLQAALSRNSSMEARIRQDAERSLRQWRSAEGSAACSCSRSVAAAAECRICTLREISDRLRIAGHNSALCKSKWRSLPGIPSGEHTYIDVVETTSKKGTTVRVVIEINFRAEFEMARASAEYNELVRCLPEVFVGKPEKLRNLIKIVCAAGKKCMKDNRMHMGPWRKHKYMEAKWLGTCERVAAMGPPLTVAAAKGVSDPQLKRRSSMLTFEFDIREKLPGLHRTAVEVV